VAVFTGLIGAKPGALTEGRASENLALKSTYSKEMLVSGARQVHLSLKLDEKGNGSGTLTFDPNIHDEFGSTCIAINDVPVQVRLVLEDGSAAKGRRVYELKPTGNEGKVDDGREHWLLIRPLKAGAPAALVFVDKDGKVQDVLVVE
jgi:hypothetical protein